MLSAQPEWLKGLDGLGLVILHILNSLLVSYGFIHYHMFCDMILHAFNDRALTKDSRTVFNIYFVS